MINIHFNSLLSVNIFGPRTFFAGKRVLVSAVLFSLLSGSWSASNAL